MRGGGDGITKPKSSGVWCLEDRGVRPGGEDTSSGICNAFILQKVVSCACMCTHRHITSPVRSVNTVKRSLHVPFQQLCCHAFAQWLEKSQRKTFVHLGSRRHHKMFAFSKHILAKPAFDHLSPFLSILSYPPWVRTHRLQTWLILRVLGHASLSATTGQLQRFKSIYCLSRTHHYTLTRTLTPLKKIIIQ